MPRSRVTPLHPNVEALEARRLLGGLSAAHPPARDVAGKPVAPPTRFLAYRITNPTGGPVNLVPPFQQVAVQRTLPVPGQVENVLYVALKNGTAQTFTAGNGFTIRLPGTSGGGRIASPAFPVLTGSQQWKPGQWIVFYALTRKYYPLSPQVSAGFQLDAGGAISTMVPGPSGQFLRVTYRPDTFARTLDWIVAYGPGAEGGAGAKLGLPDTAINELVAARTHRIDFAGHF